MRIRPYTRSATYLITRACQLRCSYASQIVLEPLRILFCGSDEFSVASLRALHKEHERDKALIESIDVVCRPPKRVGRGLKNTRQGNYIVRSPFSVHFLNQQQYQFPWLRMNFPCLYIRLTHSPSGRSAFFNVTVDI